MTTAELIERLKVLDPDGDADVFLEAEERGIGDVTDVRLSGSDAIVLSMT